MIENEKEVSEELGSSTYWESFAAYYDNPEAAQLAIEEMVAEAPIEDKPVLGKINRRHFLALMGTSAALAGAGCNDYYDQGEIIPYNKKPVDYTPGNADFYASTIFEAGDAHSVHVKVREGRPIKIDGNPNHPVSLGKVNQRVQASIMDFYDPERIQKPLKGKESIEWAVADKAVAEALSKLGSKSLAIVSHSVLSPSANEVLKRLEKKYKGQVYSYELTGTMVRDQAWELSFGGKKAPVINWEKPNIIVALEADFLGAEGNTTEATRKYTSRRSALSTSPAKDFNKLYVVEGQTSATGMNADFRFRLNPAKQVAYCLNLIQALSAGGVKFDATVLAQASKAEKTDVDKTLVSDLIKNKGKSLVYAGEKLPLSVHILVNLINDVLGNQDAYDVESSVSAFRPVQTVAGLSSLVADMNAGKIGVVVHLDTNPAYHLPSALKYAEALKKVDVSISLTEFINETSVLSTYTLPIHHSLESWGDYQARSNVYSLQQPVINPMYQTRQKEGVLLSWSKGEAYREQDYRDLIKSTVKAQIHPKFGSLVDLNVFWKAALKEGFVSFAAEKPKALVFNKAALSQVKVAKTVKDELTLILASNARLGDGRHIGNGWLQEIPHTISKVVWDNYAAMSLTLAQKLKCRTYVPSFDKNYDMITLTVEGNELTLPVLVQPGMDDSTIMVELGFGRTECTTIGLGESGKQVGFNANTLLNAKNMTPWIYTGIKASKADSIRYRLVATQEMYSMDGKPVDDGFLGKALQSMTFGEDFLSKEIVGIAEKRDIVQEVTIENGHLKHAHPVFSINDSMPYPGYKWAMAIDLNRCTGCNDCIISCNAENNVPVVGKSEVGKGREMQWMRIDRYFLGSKSTNDNPQVAFQPMLCQHCDNAPCENVCPVVATSHSDEGLNDMAYNRCVGTRYCANNCPYKVRRFNYFNFRNNLGREKWNGLGHYEKQPADLLHNPEVTLRSRGVMEKCSFCVQQIMESKQKAKEAGRKLEDGDVVSACQKACPSTAISFGNINDEKSEVRQWSNSHLNYKVLDSINVRPNVNYLAKIRYDDHSSESNQTSNKNKTKHGEVKHH